VLARVALNATLSTIGAICSVHSLTSYINQAPSALLVVEQ